MQLYSREYVFLKQVRQKQEKKNKKTLKNESFFFLLSDITFEDFIQQRKKI